MKNQPSPAISIQTDFTVEQLFSKLNQITAGEFHDAIKSPGYKYYGSISDNQFEIRNTKYGPHSNGPWIKGKISKDDYKVTVIIETDIEEQMSALRKMIYPYSIFLGLFIMAAGAFMEEIRLITLAVGALTIAFAFFQTAIIRRWLKSMQTEEMKRFNAIVRA